MRSIVEEWLEARCRCDWDRLAELTAEDVNWHAPPLGTSSGRSAVLALVRKDLDGANELTTSLLSLHTGGAVAIALIRHRSRRDGETRESIQTLFIRVADDLVAELWSLPRGHTPRSVEARASGPAPRRDATGTIAQQSSR